MGRHLVVNLDRVRAGGVDDRAGTDASATGKRDDPAALARGARHVRDARAKAKLDAVCRGVLRQGDGQAKRVADARLVAHQGTNHPGIEIGLQLQGPIASDHAHATDAIGLGTTLQLADGVHLSVVKGDDHRAIVLVAKPYLGRQPRHHTRARHVVACL